MNSTTTPPPPQARPGDPRRSQEGMEMLGVAAGLGYDAAQQHLRGEGSARYWTQESVVVIVAGTAVTQRWPALPKTALAYLLLVQAFVSAYIAVTDPAAADASSARLLADMDPARVAAAPPLYVPGAAHDASVDSGAARYAAGSRSSRDGGQGMRVVWGVGALVAVLLGALFLAAGGLGVPAPSASIPLGSDNGFLGVCTSAHSTKTPSRGSTCSTTDTRIGVQDSAVITFTRLWDDKVDLRIQAWNGTRWVPVVSGRRVSTGVTLTVHGVTPGMAARVVAYDATGDSPGRQLGSFTVQYVAGA